MKMTTEQLIDLCRMLKIDKFFFKDHNDWVYGVYSTTNRVVCIDDGIPCVSRKFTVSQFVELDL